MVEKVSSQPAKAVAHGLVQVSLMVHVLGFHPTCNRVVIGITQGLGKPSLTRHKLYGLISLQVICGFTQFRTLASRWVDLVLTKQCN